LDTDEFNYTINDGFGGAATGTVEVLVLEAPVPEENHASITPTAGGYRIRFFGASTRPYQVQRAPTVTGPWTRLTTATTSVYGLIEYRDTAPLLAWLFIASRPHNHQS